MPKTHTPSLLSFSVSVTLTSFVVLYSAYLALVYAGQAPLDLHAFRQTQTALTAYWILQEGFKLAYETPTGGAPWSIPFEFPLYQLIVASVSHLFGVSIDWAGRTISYAFLLLCSWPVFSITKRLRLPHSVFVFFVAIAFS
ncbi:MAG: hypothetical protein P8104_13335, partial [Gammaproteobacteria bacterium]